MAISIPSRLIEFFMLGPQDDRRQLQDSPILGDVWVEFGKTPSRPLDLLVVPYQGVHAGSLAAEIHERVESEPPLDVQFLNFKSAKTEPDWDKATDWSKIVIASVGRSIRVHVFNDKGVHDGSFDESKAGGLKDALKGLRPPHVLTAADKRRVFELIEPGLRPSVIESIEGDPHSIAHLQGLVVAKLRLDQVLRVVVPTTRWWLDKWDRPAGPDSSVPTHRIQEYAARSDLADKLEGIRSAAEQWNSDSGFKRSLELTPIDRFAALTGLILWAADHHRPGGPIKGEPVDETIGYVLRNIDAKSLAKRFGETVEAMAKARKSPKEPYEEAPLTYQVSLNREAMPALGRSVPAVKADAAKTLFNVNCGEIVWAVIDGGVDSTHPSFRLPPYAPAQEKDVKSRVKRIFDFKNFRRIVSLGNATSTILQRNLDILLHADNRLLENTAPRQFLREDAARDLRRLAEDAKGSGPIHWELVRKFIELAPGAPPVGNHGTHVAGILGASKSAAEETIKEAGGGSAGDDLADGMCPDITIYDFRVLGATVKDTEFAIIAALQFLRYLNAQDKFLTVHGANLSLSIPHDVRNYACGRTPICEECERLVESGVVVVAAAGNRGYQNFQTGDGSYEGYAAFSVTDPGNADGVITVGSTHRFWPHTYGVSFFSSRGPTGDGRLKPDLVAPGERIRAPVPGGRQESGGGWEDLDGTSMAAPHVSGAAAMLMARYSELIGQPRRIKRLLCESATDLGRERSFQGRGMLDVLRAFQSI